jgi:nucleoside-diphosphate-sugar epimerase
VYGPGPGAAATSLQESLLRPVIERNRTAVPALPPGGMGLVYSTGLATGQLLAAERGVPGERYILCDGHMSFRHLAATAVDFAGRGKVPPVMPVAFAKALAAAGEVGSRILHKPPLLPRGQLHFFLWDVRPQSAKAERELGWVPTPLEEGLRAVVSGLA